MFLERWGGALELIGDEGAVLILLPEQPPVSKIDQIKMSRAD